MISAQFRAAVFAVLVVFVTGPVLAQQPQAAAQDDGGDYKPPAHLIARTPPEGGPSGGGFRPVAAQAGQKTIGLISVIGDSFLVKTVGVTTVGNEKNEFPIGAWKVDDRVAAKVASILAKNFRVKRIAVPAGIYQKYEKAHGGTDSRERQRKLVADFAASQKFDYYLLVAPGGSIVGSTNQGVGGLGVLRDEQLFSPVEWVYALSELTVYDPQFKILRSESGSIGQDGFLATLKGPHQELSGEANHLPKDPKAAASDPRARQLTIDLLDKSLAMTVPKLFATD